MDDQCVTVQYNLGRLYEDRGMLDKACEKYKAILERHPSYPDCFLRLAACEEARGKQADAIGWAQKELTMHPKRPDAWCALGNLYLHSDDYKRADQTFRNVLTQAEEDGPKGEKVVCKRDSYALCQLAWLQIKLASAATPASAPMTACCTTSSSGHEKVDKAAEMFRKVLTDEPNNLYAANGLGVVCVAKGRLNEAKQIFTQVREASPSCEAATLNLAQINAAIGEHATALSLYDTIAKRVTASGGDDKALLPIMLLQGRSHFSAGKLADCRKCLEKAVAIDPTSHASWHNLGLALLAGARHPEGPDAQARPVAEVTQAILDAKAARVLFRALNPSLVAANVDLEAVEVPEGGVDPVGAAAASDPALVKVAEAIGLTSERRRGVLSACESTLRDLEDENERAVEQEARNSAAQAEGDAKMREYERQREEVEAELKRKRDEEEAASKEAIRMQNERLAQKLEAWREADAAAAAAEAEGKKKRKKGPTEEDMRSNNSDDEGGGGGGGGRNAGVDADADAALFGSSDGSDDESFKEGDGGDESDVSIDDDDEDGKEEGGEEASAEDKAAKKAAKKEAKKAAKKAAKKEAKAEAKAARKAAKKEAKAAAKAAASASAAAEDDDDDAAANLFGSDDDDDAAGDAAAAAGAAASGGEGRSLKKRKVVMDEDEDEDGIMAVGAEAEGGAAEGGAAKRQKRVLDDEDDD